MKLLSFNMMRGLLLLSIVSLILSGCRPDPTDPGSDALLDDLVGTWVRVESNNPINDFMKVEFTKTGGGIIVDDASSGFSEGSIKWRNVVASTINTTALDYEELGSDGAYYAASIRFVSDNELSITVEASGAGNAQKWLRDDGTIIPVAAQILDCNAANTELVLANTDAPVDYIIPNGCVLDVTKGLTIEPGVVIEVEENGGIGVYDQGFIKAVGTASQPIIIRGTDDVRGLWRGIHIETNTLNNQLDHVTIANAGSNYVYCCNTVGSIFLKDGQLSIKNTTITTGEGYGLVALEKATLREYEALTITDHKENPLYIHMERAGELDGMGSDYTGNDENSLFLFKSTLDQETIMPETNIPYLVEGVMDIKSDLVLEAGVRMEMLENSGLGVYENGTLSLDGTASKPVAIGGKEGNKGYWRGIHIETNSSKNVFTYAEISDAGSNYVYCCNTVATVFLKGGKLAMSNTTLSNGAEYGLYADDGADLVNYSANKITTHDKFPTYMAAERYNEIDGTASSYTGNTRDFLGIFNSDVDDESAWSKNDVPYFIEGVLDVKEPLTIAPGAEVVFEESAGLGVYDQGALTAIGTASERIIFRGFENTTGYWRGIHTETNSSKNEIAYADIRNGGSNYVYCCNNIAALIVKDGQMTLTNSSVVGSGGCGVFVRASATLTESDNTFADNTDGDICN